MPSGVTIRVGGAPNEAATAASSVEVSESVGRPTSYRLEYVLESADGDFALLGDDTFGPGSDLSVLVQTTDATECLVKGPVYGQQITLEQGGSGTLVVMGADS